MRSICITALYVVHSWAMSPETEPLPSGDLDISEYPTVVVIPDVHGDFDAALQSLYMAYKEVTMPTMDHDLLTPKQFFEIFDDVVLDNADPRRVALVTEGVALVQLGDLIDKGPYSAAAIDLFENVEAILGWKVLKLYGNHEVKTMTSTYSESKGYVDDADVEFFETRENRICSFHKNGKYYNTLIRSNLGMVRWAASAGIPQASGTARANTLFVHAGIDMSWFNYVEIHDRLELHEGETREHPGAFVDRLNHLIRQYLVDYSFEGTVNTNVPFLLNPNSPMSTRAVSREKADNPCGLVDDALRFFDVDRIVVGHSPQETRLPLIMCDGKFVDIDIGMSAWMFPDDGSQPMAYVMRANPGDGSLLAADVLLEQPVAPFFKTILRITRVARPRRRWQNRRRNPR